jgi:hypothetical protein
MKIIGAQLSMTSSHTETTISSASESLRAWVGQRRPDFETARTISAAVVQLSDASKATVAAQKKAANTQATEDALSESGGDARLTLMKFVIEAVTGHRIATLADSRSQGATETSVDAPAEQAATSQQPSSPQAAAGWGVEYDRHESYDESEQTTFTASGVVRTTDGKEINVDLGVTMNRSYHEESNVSVRLGDAVKKDPLVLNFDGTAAQLENTAVQFDLDGDGQVEQMPLLLRGSAYLAIDLNNDGQINSGKELFGPTSGNGYKELAAYDKDGNQFIDENDPVFEQLRLWTPAEQGGGEIVSLRDHNVGALALANVSTPFEYRTADNQSLGAVRSTGLYLSEDGSAGAMQEIDLKV